MFTGLLLGLLVGIVVLLLIRISSVNQELQLLRTTVAGAVTHEELSQRLGGLVAEDFAAEETDVT